MNEQPKLSVRCHPGNENHHIWDNNGTFWCHLTVHLPDFTKQRLRLSLGTDDIQQPSERSREELVHAVKVFGLSRNRVLEGKLPVCRPNRAPLA